ncbi:ATP-binding protein [Pyxidicoccus sp. 3LFB2]
MTGQKAPSSVELPEESPEELYESAPCGDIYTLPSGVIVKVNRTFLTWTGYTREELLAGKRFQDLLALSGKLFHDTHYVPLIQMQGSVNAINFDVVCRDGRLLPVLVNTVIKKDEAGRALFYRTTFFDISDRKHYERELLLARKKAEEATRAKADFLSMMSHEIRTPMNAIIGLSNLLDQTGLQPRQEKYVHLLRASSENLLNLLNDILDFSKLEAGKGTLEARSFDLRRLIQDVLHGLGARAEQKQLDVRMELDAQVPAWLIGDPVKLGQVVTNLVSNAIKFTEQGGVTVAVRVLERHDETVSLDLRVTDTGIGIPPERLDKVFEEFTQASNDIHRKYGGSGLGLTISQRLLELHGSRMRVESTPGKGSTFSFELRLKVGQEADASAASARVDLDSGALQGVKVLVAEDNELNVFVLSQFLRNWGVDFEVAADGQQVLERLDAAEYELVLMDLQMPGMSGYEAAQAIRLRPEERYRRLPIVALTASSRASLQERTELAGFTDFIGKPFSPEELFKKIARYSARPLSPLVVAPPAVEPPVRAAPSPRFSLKGFWDLVEGDGDALLELGALAVGNAERSKGDFQQALENADAEAFEFHAHKMKMTLELMQAHDLEAALEQGRTRLSEEGRDAARTGAIIRAIHQEVDAIIQAMRDEMQQVAARRAGTEGT